MTFDAGSRIGPYVLEGRIGGGGMGVVYRARDTRLDRTVALKVLPATKAADEESRRRFVQEAKSAVGAQPSAHKIGKPVDDGLTVSPDGMTLMYSRIDRLGRDLMMVESLR